MTPAGAPARAGLLVLVCLAVAAGCQRDYRVAGREPITITLAAERLPLVQRRDHAHFAVVRSKLNWSGGVASRDKA